MEMPEIVQETLDDEPVAATVPLGGEDALFVTPSRTLIYRAEGLLSDETVEEYPHGAERVEVSEGRRKSKVTLDMGLDGTRTFSVPTKRVDEALLPVLAGILNATDVTDPGETVKRTFRFSELTLVVTSARVVRHIGTAVWDEDFEQYHYDDVTDLVFEDGSVATSVVLTVDGRQERFKCPNQEARAVRESLESAILAHHDVRSVEALREKFADDDEAAEVAGDNTSFGDGPDPLSANPSELEGEPENATRTGDSADVVTAEATTTAGTDTSDAGDQETAPEDANGRGTVTEAVTRTASTTETAESTTADHADTGFDGAEVEQAATTDHAELVAEVAALREEVAEQREQLERQNDLFETLVEELRQGR